MAGAVGLGSIYAHHGWHCSAAYVMSRISAVLAGVRPVPHRSHLPRRDCPVKAARRAPPKAAMALTGLARSGTPTSIKKPGCVPIK